MTPISIVIITKNEAESIAACIKASKQITDDIIVVDNDSTDGTPGIARSLGCRVYHEHWDGYGANKNKGIEYAKYDWILSIDADEVPDEELIRTLHKAELSNPEIVYDIRFMSYYGKKPILFGAWGRDHHIRLFNRKLVRWSEPPVHETLILHPVIRIKKLQGYLHHYSVKDSSECYLKTIHYARLNAEKYFISGKRATFTKLYLAPAFHFIKNYVVFLGFLDGREGWDIARMISRHTRLKYRLLKKISENSYREMPQIKDQLVVEYEL
ncbi:MAG TPA: glycosyltransferase family 2 protein [Mucilaginibacter sp.]|jgi:glycosyltransferase involved in cell wall biosynthesis|nr:glycosyltransferase family 2 protein [Mucilaginibacter sp.]